MAMRFSILGSGSSGNCALLVTENTRVLIDAGFSARTRFTRPSTALHMGVTPVCGDRAMPSGGTDILVGRRVRECEPIRYLLPEGVQTYIEKAELYRVSDRRTAERQGDEGRRGEP